MGDVGNGELVNDFKSIEPSIHTFTNQKSQLVDGRMDPSIPTITYQNSKIEIASCHQSPKPYLIVVPHEDQNGHQKEILREVFPYPKGAIQTVVEKNSGNPTLDDKNGDNLSTSEKHFSRKKYRRKKMGKLNGSQSSLGSANSTVSSKSESNLVVSARDSEMSRVNSNSSLNNSASSSFRPNQVLSKSSHILRNKFLDRCESEILSDTSSNISTLSDLSGYEDEYTTIRRIISNAPNRHHNNVIAAASVNKKSCIESRLQEQDRTIRSLNTNKEDLEIQVHRLSVQLQNAVREKDVLQEQLDMMQTKLTEKSQKEYFELLKEKVNLEGQYETLKQQFELCYSDKNVLERKLEQISSTSKQHEEFVLRKESENVLKETIEALKKENISLHSLLGNTKESLNSYISRSQSLEAESEEKQIYNQEILTKVNLIESELEDYKRNCENLVKKNHDCFKREESERQEKKRIEKLLQESVLKLNATNENNDWCQNQLLSAQKLQSDFQMQLIEVKSSLSVVSADRDRCKREVEKLNGEIEENRASAVREKTSLITHLEELEADMKEREAATRQIENGKKVNHVKLTEDRFKKLEEDHKKVQKMRIEMGDLIRDNESLAEDRKHKTLLIRRLEEKMHDLRKDYVISQEKLGEKQNLINSLSEQLMETKSKLESAFRCAKEKDSEILSLKEEQSRLEAALSTANEDKEQVDDTISKLKEDMSKLSSNFYRMKHDLSAKDKQIDSITKENIQLVNSKKEMQSKIVKLSSDSKLQEEYQALISETNKLKNIIEESNNHKEQCNQTLYRLNKACDAHEIERKSMTNALKLRDEQIEDLHAGLDVYKEKLLQKDEEIFTKKDQVSKLERNFSDLQKKYILATEDVKVFQQEKEEFTELENSLRKSINDLKESLKLEKRSKDTYERKYKDVSLELISAKTKLDGNKNILDKYESIVIEFKKIKIDNNRIEEEIKQFRLENEKLKGIICSKENDIQSLNLRLEDCNKDLIKCKEHYEAINEAKGFEVTELQKALAANLLELTRLKDLLAKKEEFEEQVKIDNLNKNKIASQDKGVGNKIMQKKATRYNTKMKEDRNKEIEDLKNKYKVILLQLSNKNKEFKSLQLQISNQASIVTTNQSKEIKSLQLQVGNQASIVTTNESLVRENVELRKQMEVLNCQCNELKRDLDENQAACISKERQCNEWKEKYEGLCDFIPQRDTDFQQAINWDFMSSEIGAAESLYKSYHNPDEFERLNEEKSTFNSLPSSSTYDIQTQVTLTAEALKIKDRQIIQLNEQLSSLQSHLLSSTQQKQNKILDGERSTEPASNIPISSIDQRKHNNDPLNCCDASTMTIENVEYYDKIIKEKENDLIETLSKLNLKEIEFKEKQRRYDSNIRLLTRKLKEHMKGRRASEKDLEVMTQENGRKIESLEQQYQLLKSRYIDLEKKCQCMEYDTTALEVRLNEANLALSNTEKELKSEQLACLQMQKELGQMEELRKYGDNQKSQISSLNNELRGQKAHAKEISDAFEISLTEKKVLENRCASLTLTKDEINEKLSNSQATVAEKETLLESKSKLYEKKCQENTQLKEELALLETKYKNAEESSSTHLRKAQDSHRAMLNFEENIQSLSSSLELKDNLLKDNVNKINILEGQFKISVESLEAAKRESDSIRYQMKEAEDNHKSSVNHLNSKLIEAQRIEASLNDKLNEILKEKLSYQSQTTELRTALNVALCQLKKFKSHSTSFTLKLPSPAPLDTESLSKLMEKCSKPPPANRYLSSLTMRLSSLRDEVSALQGKIKSRDQECDKSARKEN